MYCLATMINQNIIIFEMVTITRTTFVLSSVSAASNSPSLLLGFWKGISYEKTILILNDGCVSGFPSFRFFAGWHHVKLFDICPTHRHWFFSPCVVQIESEILLNGCF